MAKRLLATALIALLLVPVPTFAALQTIPGGGLWLFRLPGNGGGVTIGTWATLDATGDRIAYIFPAPLTGNVAGVGWRTRTVTVGDIVDVRLETVNAGDANPSGALCGTNSNLAVTVASADDNVWENTTFTSACAVTAGTLYAIVLSGATFVSSGNMQIGGWTVTALGDSGIFPYSRQNATGSYSTLVSSVAPSLALKYDDGTYQRLEGSAFPILPGPSASGGFNSQNFQVGPMPDERGLKFQVPFTGSLCGTTIQMDLPSTSAAFDVVLYDAGSTPLVTWTGNPFNVYTNGAGSTRTLTFPLTATTIAINTVYRVTVKSTSANNVTLSDFDVNVAGMLNAVPGGTDFVYTQRTDAGAWTDTTTKRPLIGLKFCGLDDGASVGGGGGSHVVGARTVWTPGGPSRLSTLALLAWGLLFGAWMVSRRREEYA